LILKGDEYSEYLVSINTIKDLLDMWKVGGQSDQRGSIGTTHLDKIRELLVKCPDQAVSPLASELAFIADPHLRDSIRNDISTANRALIDGLWKAVTVFAGAASEALLLWAIIAKKCDPDIEQARLSVISSASKDPNRWGLDEYIKVAKALQLIQDDTEKQANIAREFRNLIHHGRAARLAKKCDRGTALSALAAVELIVRDLS
jgi:hypothetical protein